MRSEGTPLLLLSLDMIQAKRIFFNEYSLFLKVNSPHRARRK